MRVRFGDFELDWNSRQLFRGRGEVHLSPKAFELLRLLVETRPRALSKAELHEHLWPKTFVSEANLASLVAEIREVLDDPAREPRFVRTVHGYGYAFCGEATEVSGSGAAQGQGGRYWLICETRQIALTEGDNILGRDPDAVVWLDLPGVSRHHARIRIVGGEATLEDLGSKNGTYLRGERVTSTTPLMDGDEIRLGSLVITFRIPAPAGSTETQPIG